MLNLWGQWASENWSITAVICTGNPQLFHIICAAVPELQANRPRPNSDYCETKGKLFGNPSRDRASEYESTIPIAADMEDNTGPSSGAGPRHGAPDGKP